MVLKKGGIFGVLQRLNYIGFSFSGVRGYNNDCIDKEFLTHAQESNLISPISSIALTYDTCQFIDKKLYVESFSAIITPETQELLIQSPPSVEYFTKENLINLLDFAEELGCTTCFVAIKKSEEMSKILCIDEY